MASKKAKDRKYQLAEELGVHFANYSKMFLVDVDNVGSNQLHQIRIALRGKAIIYCGKNTQMRRVIREMEKANPMLERVRNVLKLNLAIVFTNDNLSEIRDIIVNNKVAAPARAGQVAQCNVVVPAGNTGMDPGQTSFFQALNIATKITRGLVEIINDVALIVEGERVTPGQAALLKRLDIMPFSYGLKIVQVYDRGTTFDPKVLSLTTEVLGNKLMGHVSVMSGICMEIGYPTLFSLPHMVSNSFQKIASIALEIYDDAEMATAFPAMDVALNAGKD